MVKLIENKSDSNEWVKLDSKLVCDHDGFMTDYVMYYNESTGQYIFMFGDSDYTEPNPDYADFETYSAREADDWWESYVGPGESD